MRRDERDLGAQQVDTCELEVAEDARLSRGEQVESVVESACLKLRLRRGESALRAPGRFRRQRGRALEEGPGGSEPAPRLRSGCRTLQLRGNLLIGHGRRLRPVPGAAIRVDVWIGCLGERAVDLAPLLAPGCPVHRRADQRMPEDDRGTERQQALRFDGARRPFGDAEALSGTPDQCRIADRVGRRHEQEAPRFVRKRSPAVA